MAVVGCHWTLDFTYREDESRIRDKHVLESFAWLNRFTLSLLKQHPDKSRPHHETTQLRLERRLLDASRHRSNPLVGAGLGRQPERLKLVDSASRCTTDLSSRFGCGDTDHAPAGFP